MNFREQIARDKGIDHTLSLLMEGYLYIFNRTKHYHRKMFETRLLGGQKFICMTGKEAAAIFYDQRKFIRHGAAPGRVLKTLFGEQGVQTLDGAAHRARKKLFMSLMTEERLRDVQEIFKKAWQEAFSQKREEIIFYEEAKRILLWTACTWAGVPIEQQDEQKLTDHVAAMYEGGGAIGVRHWYGRYGRRKIEAWLEDVISAVRNDLIKVPEKTALYEIAHYRDLDGKRLDTKVAAVELVNILRPIVAIAVYLTHCAHALEQSPEARENLRAGTSEKYRMFVQEVRRYYPFFPLLVAKVRNDFFWNGHDFKKDTLVLLDIYGTNHDPSFWENPDAFFPERFRDWDEDPYALIPQGGGDHHQHHRCPGEWLTMDIMETCLEMLVHQMDYEVPAQNLTLSKRQMPSLPKSGFVMRHVEKTAYITSSGK